MFDGRPGTDGRVARKDPWAADLDIEGEILGALLSGELTLRDVRGLESVHFWSLANRLVFEAMESLELGGLPWNAVSVVAWLRLNGSLEKCGGSAYVVETLPLCQPSVTPRVARVHVERLRELWSWRETRAALEDAARDIATEMPGPVLGRLKRRLRGCRTTAADAGSKSPTCAKDAPNSCSKSTEGQGPRGSAKPATGGSSPRQGRARGEAPTLPSAAPRSPTDGRRRATR
jgi:hypothetical protein